MTLPSLRTVFSGRRPGVYAKGGPSVAGPCLPDPMQAIVDRSQQPSSQQHDQPQHMMSHGQRAAAYNRRHSSSSGGGDRSVSLMAPPHQQGASPAQRSGSSCGPFSFSGDAAPLLLLGRTTAAAATSKAPGALRRTPPHSVPSSRPSSAGSNAGSSLEFAFGGGLQVASRGMRPRSTSLFGGSSNAAETRELPRATAAATASSAAKAAPSSAASATAAAMLPTPPRPGAAAVPSAAPGRMSAALKPAPAVSAAAAAALPPRSAVVSRAPRGAGAARAQLRSPVVSPLTQYHLNAYNADAAAAAASRLAAASGAAASAAAAATPPAAGSAPQQHASAPLGSRMMDSAGSFPADYMIDTPDVAAIMAADASAAEAGMMSSTDPSPLRFLGHSPGSSLGRTPLPMGFVDATATRDTANYMVRVSPGRLGIMAAAAEARGAGAVASAAASGGHDGGCHLEWGSTDGCGGDASLLASDAQTLYGTSSPAHDVIAQLQRRQMWATAEEERRAADDDVMSLQQSSPPPLLHHNGGDLSDAAGGGGTADGVPYSDGDLVSHQLSTPAMTVVGGTPAPATIIRMAASAPADSDDRSIVSHQLSTPAMTEFGGTPAPATIIKIFSAAAAGAASDRLDAKKPLATSTFGAADDSGGSGSGSGSGGATPTLRAASITLMPTVTKTMDGGTPGQLRWTSAAAAAAVPPRHQLAAAAGGLLPHVVGSSVVTSGFESSPKFVFDRAGGAAAAAAEATASESPLSLMPLSSGGSGGNTPSSVHLNSMPMMDHHQGMAADTSAAAAVDLDCGSAFSSPISSNVVLMTSCSGTRAPAPTPVTEYRAKSSAAGGGRRGSGATLSPTRPDLGRISDDFAAGDRDSSNACGGGSSSTPPRVAAAAAGTTLASLGPRTSKKFWESMATKAAAIATTAVCAADSAIAACSMDVATVTPAVAAAAAAGGGGALHNQPPAIVAALDNDRKLQKDSSQKPPDRRVSAAGGGSSGSARLSPAPAASKPAWNATTKPAAAHFGAGGASSRGGRGTAGTAKPTASPVRPGYSTAAAAAVTAASSSAAKQPQR